LDGEGVGENTPKQISDCSLVFLRPVWSLMHQKHDMRAAHHNMPVNRMIDQPATGQEGRSRMHVKARALTANEAYPPHP